MACSKHFLETFQDIRKRMGRLSWWTPNFLDFRLKAGELPDCEVRDFLRAAVCLAFKMDYFILTEISGDVRCM